MNEVDLYCLYISVPTAYEEGVPVGFKDKSIGDILDQQDIFELVVLQDWISDQYLEHIGWHLQNPVTTEIIEVALTSFERLNIKPINCKYYEEKENKCD